MGHEDVRPRINSPERRQVELVSASLDDLLPEDHWVRGVWKCVAELNLSALYDLIQSRGSSPGRSAIDPRLLLALWIAGLSEGIGSARRLAELCTRDVVYRWLCGGVTVNYHALADFRSQRGEEIDELLTQSVAVLMRAGVVNLQAAAQDGVKVRASAGASSFRRQKSLRKCLVEARAEVERLRNDLEADGSSSRTRQDAARERAANERVAAIKEALKELPRAEEARAAQKYKKRAKAKGEVRVSTTDKDARVMKMADGGFRPAFNVQLTTDVGSGCIVGVAVTNRGTDAAQIEPSLVDVLNRTGELPTRYLVDGGYTSEDNIAGLTDAGVEIYAPAKARKDGADPYGSRPGEPEPLSEWRKRMRGKKGKKMMAKRGATAERANAEMRKMGMMQFAVRGLAKATSAVILTALAFNIARLISLT